jgi:hypothetical protein
MLIGLTLEKEPVSGTTAAFGNDKLSPLARGCQPLKIKTSPCVY